MIFANSSSLLWSVRRAQVYSDYRFVNQQLVHVAILTTVHAQITRGRQAALISGPENQ